ncbi:MAG: ATP-binding cassette domain-containing protein [Planctomycetota bacterium]|nr:ATP-binding cassette domain-containing protein [Planctomycetota bacterium]
MSEPEPLVKLDSASKAFGSLRVIDSVDLAVRPGENLAVLGMSGTGKSVLLKLIIGLLRLDAGEIYLWGEPISELGEEELIPLRRRMGMVFQSGALFDSMTVFENVAYPLYEAGDLEEPDIRGRVEEFLEWVGLPGVGPKRPSELSGGMRKRVSLARTMVVRPELILYDEPTAGLDPVTGRRISLLIREMGERIGTTYIVVTHDVDCAFNVARRWSYLCHGNILADGSPEELFGSSDPEVRSFLAPWAAMLAPAASRVASAGRSPEG